MGRHNVGALAGLGQGSAFAPTRGIWPTAAKPQPAADRRPAHSIGGYDRVPRVHWCTRAPSTSFSRTCSTRISAAHQRPPNTHDAKGCHEFDSTRAGPCPARAATSPKASTWSVGPVRDPSAIAHPGASTKELNPASDSSGRGPNSAATRRPRSIANDAAGPSQYSPTSRSTSKTSFDPVNERVMSTITASLMTSLHHTSSSLCSFGREHGRFA